jgi:D-alanyl-D-alanine dipeptidase
MRKPAPEQDASGFVLLAEYLPSVIQEIRYHSTYNFIGDRINGYEDPVALCTRECARALKDAAIEMFVQGYRLKIFDAYRPETAVRHFVFWGLEDNDQRMKPYFYPDIDKTDTFKLGYIASRSSHSRGSTVDLTLFDMKTGHEVDMGSPFDLFGERSHPSYTGITEEQYDARMLLRRAMTRAGFEPYECEWWHFTLADEPYPDRYFDFPVAVESVRA